MYKTILIVALCLVGIFIHPFDPGIVDFIYRFIIFSIIVYLVYTMYREAGEQDEETFEPIIKPLPTPVKDEFIISDNWQLGELIESDERTRN